MKKYYEKIKAAEPKRQRREKYIKRASIFALTLIIFFLVFWIIGLFKTPANFKTVEPAADEHISPYLSNYILPELHNKSQYREPFDLIVSQEGINEVIARHIDPNTLAKAGLSDLSACFKKGEIILTARTNYKGFDFIASMVIELKIDKYGKLLFDAADFQLGNSSLPFVAEAIKKKILNSLDNHFKGTKNDEFINALFSNGNVEPVFKSNHSKLRIEKINVEDRNLTLRFSPQ